MDGEGTGPRALIADVRAHLLKRRDPVAHARSLGVEVGRNCRLIDVSFGSEPYLVSLGDHVSASGTRFVTHDGGVWVFRDEHPDADVFGPIRVGNNVFLGEGVIVLPGVTINDDVVVGAGAVVAGDVASGQVVAGVPARPIKTLDEYWADIEDRVVPTKRMSAAEKRAYLLRRG